MKKAIFLLLLACLALSATAQARLLPEVILGPGLNSGRTPYFQAWNRTLSADTLYTLTGLYNVDSTYTLTVPAGTIVKGDTAACLIVKRGAQVFINGEVNKPVVFTSRKPAGTRAPGDWGGILVLGRAPINKFEPLIEGGIIGGTYGGNDPNDNSGVIKYCRIEFPGYRFQLNNEVNGLTMGGVGAGTEIHHVQVSYSFDDAYEWFGGTVNAHHLVAIGTTDDQLDTDFGYVGKVQFVFAMDDPNYWDPTGETNGFESDNDGSSSSQATPFTHPIFSNVTLVGPERNDAIVGNLPAGHKFQYSAVLRRSTRTSIFNSVIAGYPWGLSIRDPFTIASATGDVLRIRNTSITASATPSGSASVHDEGRWAGVTAWFNTAGYNNIGSAPRNPSAVGFTSMVSLTAPDPVPAPGSELIGTASFADSYLNDPFFVPVTYRGAFDPNVPMDQQWTAGWTEFDPQNYDPELTDVAQPDAPRASLARLVQNHPNPFNPATVISFSVPQRGHVTLKVYNVRGQEVAALVDGELPAGEHQVVFAPSNLPSGSYLYRLIGNGFSETRTMQLVK